MMWWDGNSNVLAMRPLSLLFHWFFSTYAGLHLTAHAEKGVPILPQAAQGLSQKMAGEEMETAEERGGGLSLTLFSKEVSELYISGL